MRKDELEICIVDDEDIVRITIHDELRDAGYNVSEFDNPLDALDYIRQIKPAIILTDVKMPQMDGMSLLKKVNEVSPNSNVVIMTSFGSVKSAVDAIKLGAFQYLTKPFKHAELENILKQLFKINTLTRSNLEFQNHFKAKYNENTFWGESDPILKIKDEIDLISNTDATVLITGETGTGKEVLANVIHYSSRRASKPLIKVSCAILSPEIIESELFGHEKGSFTGAERARTGRFEEADKGTIYLDDIDDVPMELQVKLLRVLQESEIERLGSSKPIKIDVRVLASTKVNLRKLVDEGRFREDLFYRINVFPINIPPLRERPSDVPLLVDNFLHQFGRESSIEVENSVYGILQKHIWPGNVRELKNFVQRSIILAKNGKIDKRVIPLEFCQAYSKDFQFEKNSNSLPMMITNFEKNILEQAIAKCNGNKNKAAKLLGIPITTLRSKIEKLNI